ncbi:MAG: phenylalanine--tRNA ligase subunit beta [Candidatus Cyclonatronum sp.]|uniref:phenylalanine--tRNA ligase subunit beta n=1 Tax=Cyclonatronum sp. TaxID=3024185 RepID=UPI0025BC150D|nr:phenylalanine--tRNA ligase subunit beta [Cyclonatronum sp.]MCH8485531.1 phenylalanine--tRNA ligase subunit beta [Cyclonatronum sp.]
MKISLNWLRDYISTSLTGAEIADKLTLTGLEVDELETVGSDFAGVVVGEVLSAQKHPNADKLTLCQVNTGADTVQIVCGAPNVATGQKVAVATVGTTLPLTDKDGKPFKIRKSKIRGEVSFGMICAEDELGIGTDHSGIMVLDQALVPGTPFGEVVPPTRDTVLEIGLTPNRPDAACHTGTARDLFAVTGETFTHPAEKLKAADVTHQPDGNPAVQIRIENTSLCHRYVGIVMKNVKVQPSPRWVQNRLKAIGLRPRNAVVDATNYVMHELGQPLHAFDLKTLRGPGILVKSFDSPVNFTTLDETAHEVPAGSLFICDEEKPVALAGIMGGLNSEIQDDTTEILIESAWFDPVSIRKTARTLSLQTDSSYRFERGADPRITLKAALRCAQLITEWTGAESVGPVTDIHPVAPQLKQLSMRIARAHQIIGTEIPQETMISILSRLGFEPKAEGSLIHCTVPSFRPDVSIEVDLIEEIARIYDYNNIPTTGRISFARPPVTPFDEQFTTKLHQACLRLGLTELYNNSLLPENIEKQLSENEAAKLVRTLNPISRDQAIMRPDLSYGFLKSAAYNFNRKATGFRAFEIGRVFRKGDGNWIKGIQESKSLLLGLAGNKQDQHWQHPAMPFAFHDLKALVEGLLKQLRLSNDVTIVHEAHEALLKHGNRAIGRLYAVSDEQRKRFDLDVPAFIAEINCDELVKLASNLKAVRYQFIPKFPPFEFDIALIVDSDLEAVKLMDYIRTNGGNRLKSVDVFDVFEGKSIEAGKKSIAFRLIFQDAEKTLTIEDVNTVIKKLTAGLEKTLGAQLRG